MSPVSLLCGNVFSYSPYRFVFVKDFKPSIIFNPIILSSVPIGEMNININMCHKDMNIIWCFYACH